MASMRRRALVLAVGLAGLLRAPRARGSSSCAMVNFCSGHGYCVPEKGACVCDGGWGGPEDVHDGYLAPDCSQRVCPKGRAWGSVPTSATAAHAEAECSNQGVCDREVGLCICASGFVGAACQNRGCPNDCSGHGRCMPMIDLARTSDGEPLVSGGAPTYAPASFRYSDSVATTTWDQYTNFACLCDSSWTVGLGSGETQRAQYFGADCSLMRCPSANDPVTDGTTETDCAGSAADGARGYGSTGNLCHVECSRRGTCDRGTGACECFPGYYGAACENMDAWAGQK